MAACVSERYLAVECGERAPELDPGEIFVSLLGRGTTRVSVAKAEVAVEAARRRLAEATTSYESWIARLQRLFGAGEPRRVRLERARRIYWMRVDALERAREDELVARNASRLVMARAALEQSAGE